LVCLKLHNKLMPILYNRERRRLRKRKRRLKSL